MYKGSFSVRWQGLSIVGTSVFYAISSSGVQQPSDDTDWSPSIINTTKAKPYLWTKVVTTYNDGSTSSSYSVSRQGTDGTDGTNFTPSGTALGHYAKFSDLASSVKNPSVGDVYILDMCSSGGSVNSSIPNPCVVTFMDAPDYSWYAKAAEVGDAYNVDGRLWVNNGDEWADFGEVKGADGKDGEDGHNLTLQIYKATGNADGTKYVYDTDNDGELVGGGHTHFIYFGRFGDEVITDNTDGAEFVLEFPDDCNFNPHQAGLNEGGSSPAQGYFDTDGITRTNYTVGDEKMTAVCTSAYFLVCLSYKGFAVKQRIDFAVNLSLFNGSVVQSRYDWTAKYARLQEKQTEQGKLIEKNESELKVQADSIASKVSQTEYDENGKEIRNSISEVSQKADGIKARVEAVEGDYVKSAEISMMVKKDENGVLESDVTVNADNINLQGQRMDFRGDQITIETNNFTLDANGNMTANDATFGGTIRTPYRKAQSGEDLSKTDNIFLESSSWFNFFELKWDKSQIGRTIRIANYTEDSAIFSATSGKFFVTVNGMQTNQIGIAPMRCCVLHGLGYGDNFIAWCVEQSYAYKASLPQYDMKYLAKGFVTVTSNVANIERQKTCDGTITVKRISTGYYRLSLPTSWSAAYNQDSVLPIYKIGVMLQGFGYSKDDGHKQAPIKATVKGIGWTSTSRTQLYVDVWTSDDETVNDGDFQFIIYNLVNSLDE